MRLVEDVFGVSENPLTKASENIRRFTFANRDQNVSIQVITLGATITSIKLPDAAGAVDDVVLGYDDVAGYKTTSNPYFGSTVGRVCNRIGHGRFVLDGREISVSKNLMHKHQLHGGFVGFDKVHWDVVAVNEVDCSVVMRHVSAAGHEGYPGELTATVKFRLTADNCFHVTFGAVATDTTVVNMTNHSYFNLAGHATGKAELYEHLIQIAADEITATDEESIPTGALSAVAGTAFDLRKLGKLGERLKSLSPAVGYDDNFCVTLKNGMVTTIAKVTHPKSGRWMEVATDQPGVQFYTSNFMPDPDQKQEPIIGKGGAKYQKHGALCLETQKYPDAPNHTNFRSITLRPGEKYNHEVIYKFGVCK